MNGLESIASGPMWAAFVGFVIVMLALDLFVFGGNKAHKVSVKEAGIWSLVWVSLALLFNGGLWWYLKGTVGAEIADQKALEFFSGYLIEKALSVDNVFVFLLIFTAFQVPQQYQRRVLIYGVLGAIVMRAIMISAGAWVVSEFSWVLYLFGAFLLYTGLRMLVAVDQEPDVANNPVLRFARRHLKVAEGDHGERFFVTVPLAWAAEFGADPDRLNPAGGAIALGHALGASGTRLLTSLVNHLEATGGRFGLQTMCEGGGMANATIVERLT